MSFAFHPDAEAEFEEAIEYYEEIEQGLGYDFTLEVYSAIQRSVDFPKAWSLIESEIRRSLLNRFPYGVLYSEEQDGLLNLAVMHLHRHPDYWKHRRAERTVPADREPPRRSS